VRMLTNHDMDSGTPFAAVLIGQPTLRQRLRLGVLAALDQRISVRYAIAGMDATETGDYITHHLKIAGRSDTAVQRHLVGLGRVHRPAPVSSCSARRVMTAPCRWVGRPNE